MTFVLAILALVAALPAAAETTLDEIIATNIESKGGLDAIKAIKSMRIEGRMQMGPGMEAPITVEMKRPGSMRIEFVIQGMTGIQAYDGETGWQVMPFTGSTEPEKITGEELENLADQADFDGPFVNHKERSETLEYLGTEEVDGTPAHKIKVTKENGTETIVFLDTEYCLEIKAVAKTNMQGMEVEMATAFGDYKEVAGVMMAHSMNQSVVGAQAGQAITFEKIEANVDLADDRFAMPAAEPAATE
ncbi:hypothetical protein ABI59_12840 [Acidobacteria bacterium Mor1]|nr:hypothetical protein ABI59_12840 [Acidobacteria bacterium Mor1]